jgi:transcriptional regulator
MVKKKPKTAAVPPPADKTRRQRIVELLEKYTLDFEALRRELGVTRKGLEEELGHLDKSLAHKGARLKVDPAVCNACGYLFKTRRDRRFHAPKRCPECKEERVTPPAFSIVVEGVED